MNGIFANYLWTMFWGSIFWIFWIMLFSPWKYKYRCIRVYARFKDDKHVIWIWIWLILKNINLLDRMWSLWFVRFAHSPPKFIFWLGRLIFSASINSHPDNIYLSSMKEKKLSTNYSDSVIFFGFNFINRTSNIWHTITKTFDVKMKLSPYHFINLTFSSSTKYFSLCNSFTVHYNTHEGWLRTFLMSIKIMFRSICSRFNPGMFILVHSINCCHWPTVITATGLVFSCPGYHCIVHHQFCHYIISPIGADGPGK